MDKILLHRNDAIVWHDFLCHTNHAVVVSKNPGDVFSTYVASSCDRVTLPLAPW